MGNLFHISAIVLGLLAYIFSDVNSNSGFTNTFLPFLVLTCFIYGLVVTINLIYHLRKKPNEKNMSTDLLLASMKELKDKEQHSDAVKVEPDEQQPTDIN